MIFERFVNVATEEADTREPIPNIIIVELDAETPSKELNVQKYFTATTDEKLTYGIEVADEHLPFITFDEIHGNLTFNARMLPVASDYYVNVFAINQWRNRSPPKLIQVQETQYIIPKPLASAPTQIHLHSKVPNVQIPMSALFKDSDIFTYAMSIAPPNLTNPSVGAKFNNENKVLEVQFKEVTRTYTITMTAHMFSRNASVIIHVKEENIFAPLLRTDRQLPKAVALHPISNPQFQVNLNNYFMDNPQNALLSVNRGNTILAYTALADPPSMQSSVSVVGSMLTIRSRRLAAKFTVTITAMNAGGKSVKTAITVQDSQ